MLNNKKEKEPQLASQYLFTYKCTASVHLEDGCAVRAWRPLVPSVMGVSPPARRAEGLVFFNYSVMAGSLPQFSHELS